MHFFGALQKQILLSKPSKKAKLTNQFKKKTLFLKIKIYQTFLT